MENATVQPSGNVSSSAPQSPADNTPTPVATSNRSAPPQMKKRNKGSLFLSVLFMSLLGLGGYLLFTNFLKFESYGEIEGRLIGVAAPWNGTVANWQVRDGDMVTQGQIIARMENVEMQHQLGTFGDELKILQAQLESEMSRIEFDTRSRTDASQKANAEYLQASGDLAAERSSYADAKRKLERARKLHKTGSIAREQYEKVYYIAVGQKKKIEQLTSAVEVLRNRSARSPATDHDGSDQLKPLLAEIEHTQSQIRRLRQRIDSGDILAPCNGRVTRRYCLTGEAARDGDTMVEVLEDNSIEAVLYVPQEMVDHYEVGAEVAVVMEPYDRELRCTVVRFGEQYEKAPISIERYYQHNQFLLPVYLKPLPEYQQWMALRIHGTVKRPYTVDRQVSTVQQFAADWWNRLSKSESPVSDSNDADPKHAEPPLPGHVSHESDSIQESDALLADKILDQEILEREYEAMSAGESLESEHFDIAPDLDGSIEELNATDARQLNDLQPLETSL